ncbi:MAG: N-acetylmuramoyl-L-alanine amidase [Bacilli bacterium]
MKKIVIDAGHGGSDGGATANGIVEKDYTLKISNYMYDRLKELGVPVSITRSTDITLDPNERVEKALDFYGNGNDVIVVSNHINAGGGDGHCVTNV